MMQDVRIKNAEICNVSGSPHQWAYLERMPGGMSPITGSPFFSQEHDRWLFFCQFCLLIKTWDDLVGPITP